MKVLSTGILRVNKMTQGTTAPHLQAVMMMTMTPHLFG